MRHHCIYSILVFTLLPLTPARAQIVLDPKPARVIGHPNAELINVSSYSPNLVEGKELYLPQGIALDTSGSTPILYVADTGNHRVLAWQHATSTTLSNLQKPDKIIGQPDAYTTLAGINNTGGNSGLTSPTGLLVDSKGNLYVADSGNNRVVRFPAPFSSGTPVPDMVLGQPDPFSSNRANQGLSAPTANTLSLPSNYPTAMAMDSSGNLYVTDAGNRRVLRYPAASLTANNFGPAADLVLGEPDFVTVAQQQGPLDRSHVFAPTGLAFDSGGHLFVSDAYYGRVVVFSPPFTNGVTASRLAGVVSPAPTGATQSTFSQPQGIVMINDGPAVLDAANNRILVFDSFNSADWKTTDATLAKPAPIAIAVIGQANYTSSSANAGNAQPSAGTLNGPVAGALAGTDLFIADTTNNRVLIFPNSGQGGSASVVLGQSGFSYNSVNYIQGKEFSFGPNIFSINGQGVALWDAGIAVDWASTPPHLYVSDPGNNRVLGFADARKLGPGATADIVIGQPDMSTAVCNFGGVHVQNPPAGQLPQQPTQSSLCYPVGLAVDPGGNLYVADSVNGRVLRFPAPFKSGSTSSEQADLVLGQSGFTGLKNPTVSASFMGSPYGLVFDPLNGLLVSDRTYNRVLLFSKDNLTNGAAAIKVIGQTDFTLQSSSTLLQPAHIAEDSNNRVYVADSGHDQVLIFGSLPNLSTATTVSLNAITGLTRPQAVWVNSTSVAGYPDDIWVGDGSNGALRYQRFALLGPPGSNNPTFIVPSAALKSPNQSCGPGSGQGCLPTLAITQDPMGNLYVADYSNRVAIHYQALATTNGASFICAGGCTLGGLADPQYYLAPGVVASVFGFSSTQFGQNTADFGGVLPVPTTVGDIQVTVNGLLSPIFHIVPNQINFVVPSNAPNVGDVPLQVVQKSTGQVLGSGTVRMNTVAPAMFTNNQSGVGQIAALNQDNTKNSSTNPAARKSVIQLFGTGQGLVPGAPPDGQLPQGLVQTSQKPQIFIGGFQVPDANIQFSGLAPCCVGLWQINVEIPDSTAPGNSVSLLVNYLGTNSFNDPQHITTIAVH